MIVGFVLAFIAFFVATMMTFQGNLPVPVAVIIQGCPSLIRIKGENYE